MLEGAHASGMRKVFPCLKLDAEGVSNYGVRWGTGQRITRRRVCTSAAGCQWDTFAEGGVTVTTMDAAAARRWNPWMARAILIALTGIGLGRLRDRGLDVRWVFVRLQQPPAPEIAAPSSGRTAAAARQSRGGAHHRCARCDRQTDPAGIHERSREAARVRGRGQGRARRLHAARLHRRGQGQVGDQGVLHLGHHRSRPASG